MKEKLILVGGGGHCHACIDVVEATGKYEIAGIIDVPDNVGKFVLGYKIIGSDADLEKVVKEYGNFLITIGQIKTVEKRVELFQKLKNMNANMPNIISPRAYVSRHAQFGQGNIIMHNAVVNANANFGDCCIVNTGAVVEHDVKIGCYIHVSTGAVVNGGVSIKDRVFIGSNAILREGVEIGSNSIIGGGAVVMGNVADNALIKPDRPACLKQL